MSIVRVLRDPETKRRLSPALEPVDAPHAHRYIYDFVNDVYRCSCGKTVQAAHTTFNPEEEAR